MKNDFKESGLPPVKWYLGETVLHEGELKLEWHSPDYGLYLHNEESLAMLERSARDMLIERHKEVEPEWTTDIHAKWRDIHCNAEYGLARLQEAKMAKAMTLQTPCRPVVK